MAVASSSCGEAPVITRFLRTARDRSCQMWGTEIPGTVNRQIGSSSAAEILSNKNIVCTRLLSRP
eukprot:SAG31_NODE_18550_length_632_cov_1.001876_1_plen_64_part_01